MSATPYILGGAAAILVVANKRSEDGEPPPAAAPVVVGGRTGTVAGLLARRGLGISGKTPTAPGQLSPSQGVANPALASTGNWATSANTAAKEQVAALEEEMRAKYDALSKEAKKAGAEYLNRTVKPNPGLTGEESLRDASKKVGASVGGTVGAAACAAIPYGGVALAPLCAIGGAYLGAEFGPIIGRVGRRLYESAGRVVDRNARRIRNAAGDVIDAVTFW